MTRLVQISKAALMAAAVALAYAPSAAAVSLAASAAA